MMVTGGALVQWQNRSYHTVTEGAQARDPGEPARRSESLQRPAQSMCNREVPAAGNNRHLNQVTHFCCTLKDAGWSHSYLFELGWYLQLRETIFPPRSRLVSRTCPQNGRKTNEGKTKPEMTESEEIKSTVGLPGSWDVAKCNAGWYDSSVTGLKERSRGRSEWRGRSWSNDGVLFPRCKLMWREPESRRPRRQQLRAASLCKCGHGTLKARHRQRKCCNKALINPVLLMSGAVTIHMMSVNIYIYMETLGCIDINIDIRYKLRVNSAFPPVDMCLQLLCKYLLAEDLPPFVRLSTAAGSW